MKKFFCIFLTLLIACSCLLFSGCSIGRKLYRGDKSLITSVSIAFPFLEGSRAILNAEDQSAFIKQLEKTKVVKVEKSAVFNSRSVPDNYFAYVNVKGDSSEAISVAFYVLFDGKVQVDGQLIDSWYDSQLNKASMDIIIKYQGDFKPSVNLQYYYTGTAAKIADNNSQTEIKTYDTSLNPEQAIILKFLDGLTIFSSNQMPKQQIVADRNQILPSVTADETYAFTLGFKTNVTRPLQKSYYFCGIVASSSMVRIIVEKKEKTKIQYILTDYEMDGSAIKESIKALTVAI